MQMTKLTVVFDLKHSLTVVFAAGRANLMSRLVAVAAFTANQMLEVQGIVRASITLAPTRDFSFGEWPHDIAPPAECSRS
jgi:hypothetical protein